MPKKRGGKKKQADAPAESSLPPNVSIMAGDDRVTPLLADDRLSGTSRGEGDDAAAADSRIPPLNPEDPLFGLRSSQVTASREAFGWNEIVVPETPLWKMFLSQFVGFLPLLIELAGIISLVVRDWPDFGIICAMLLVNAFLGFHEEHKAKKSLDELSKELESEVAVRREGETTQLNVKELVPGDVILLVGGTIVPADTQWMKGDVVQVDTAPLTGEPLPRKYPGEHGDVILSGTTVVAGECYGRVLRTGDNTEIGKAQADVLKDKTVRVVSVFQQKIMVVVQALVMFCIAFVVAVLLVQGIQNELFKTDTKQAILSALSILIASIPIALPLVVQVNLALGASFLAKNYHAIVTSMPALQDISSMSMLCSDKTGTLTTANMSIIEDQIYAGEGYTEDDILMYASLCSNADKKDDPIDRAIITAMEGSSASSDGYTQTEIIGFNPSVKRVVAFVTDPSGATKTIAKGLPAKILDTEAGAHDDHELQWKVAQAADKAFMEDVLSKDKHLSTNGYKTIAVAVCEGNARELGDAAVWRFAGLLPMLDPPRHDTPATIESLHHANISVKMITGDHVNVGKETARLIGLGTAIYPGETMRDAPAEEKTKIIYDADGFASVLPSDKREIVVTLRNQLGLVCGMTGDGVNDAPALSAANVGIAVDGATDAAKNAADLILTKSGLSPIYGAVLESRRIFSRIKSYVIYRVAASLVIVLTLSIIVFVNGCAVESLYIIILALLNDLSMIPVAYDNASATTRPQVPKARKLVFQSLFYGLIHAGLGLGFLFLMDWAPNLQYNIDMSETCNAEAQGFIWFHLLLSTELMIFSVRSPGLFFSSMPSPKLILSVLVTLVGGGFIACLTPALGLHGNNLGYVVAYNVVAFIVVDILKISFRNIIGEDTGDIITSDELIEPPVRTEAAKKIEKDMRYVAMKEAVVDPDDYGTVVEVKERSMRGFFSLGGDIVNDGFVRKAHRTSLMHASSMQPLGGARKRTKQVSSPLG